MRFKRPSQPVAAIRCPSCRHIFEVESASLQEEPIVAQIIEEEPVAVIAVEDVAIPARVTPVVPVQPSQQTTSAPLRPVLPHKNKTAKKVHKPYNPALKKRALIVGSITASLLLCSVAAFYLTKYLNSRSQPSALVQLANRFEKNLDGVRHAMLAHQSNPNQAEVNREALALRDLLIDCVNTQSIPESDFDNISAKLNELSDLQVEVRRLSNQIAPNFDRKSLVDQLPSMIELINKQLNYGLRQPRTGNQPVDRFCQQTFPSYRKVDKLLGEAIKSGDINLEEMGQRIDELDQEIVEYSKSAESRVELGFENKQILECGSAWRAWCLRQVQLSGRSAESQAVTRELDEIGSRFELALKASAVEPSNLAAFNRLTQRMDGSSLTAAIKPTKDGSSTSPNSSVSSNQPISPTSSYANSPSTSIPPSSSRTTNPSTTNELESSSSAPIEVQQPTSTVQSTPTSKPSTTTGSPSDGTMASTVPPTSQGSNSTDSRSMPASTGVLVFPSARYQGPGTLAIKVTTKKTRAELQQIGTQIASRIGGVVDLQINDSLATLSFSNYAGKVHDVIKHVGFGKVEISDMQSRTLFVNDFE